MVADDGKGFNVGDARSRSGGLGLVSIDERVRSMRGRIHIRTTPGRGTRVEVDWRIPGGTSDIRRQLEAQYSGLVRAGEFEREGSAQSVTNVWAVEVRPRQSFAYELRRPGRFFRVEFDLARTVPTPPPAWGSE